MSGFLPEASPLLGSSFGRLVLEFVLIVTAINENPGQLLTGLLVEPGEAGKRAEATGSTQRFSCNDKHSTSGTGCWLAFLQPATFWRGNQRVDVGIEQLKAGDRMAWDKAYGILYAISLSVCAASAGDLNHHDHEDVAAEAITQIIDYIEKVNSFEDCKKLVVTISKNRLLDRYRRRSIAKHGRGEVESLEQKEGFDAVDLSQQQPDVAVINGERALLLKEALTKIPEQYRKVVEDFYLKELTQQAIADQHVLKIGSIGVYLQRGLEALHKILPKDGW